MKKKDHSDLISHGRVLGRYHTGVIFFAICLLLPSYLQTALAAIYADFSDNTTWTPQVYGNGPYLVNNADGFTAVIPGNSSPTGTGPEPTLMSAGYVSTFFVHGNFTIDVGYSLPQWPISNGTRLGIGIAAWYGSQRVSQVFVGSPPGDEAYVFVSGGINGVIPTTDTTGTLRLARTGATLAGYYLGSSGNWTFIGSGPVSTADFNVGIGAWTDNNFFSHQNVQVDFSNVEVVPEPATIVGASLLLLPIVLNGIRHVLGQLSGSRRKN